MEDIKSSFWGYNKEEVKNIITEKDKIIDAQKKDIDFLRSLANGQNTKNTINNFRGNPSKQPNDKNDEPEMQ